MLFEKITRKKKKMVSKDKILVVVRTILIILNSGLFIYDFIGDFLFLDDYGEFCEREYIKVTDVSWKCEANKYPVCSTQPRFAWKSGNVTCGDNPMFWEIATNVTECGWRVWSCINYGEIKSGRCIEYLPWFCDTNGIRIAGVVLGLIIFKELAKIACLCSTFCAKYFIKESRFGFIMTSPLYILFAIVSKRHRQMGYNLLQDNKKQIWGLFWDTALEDIPQLILPVALLSYGFYHKLALISLIGSMCVCVVNAIRIAIGIRPTIKNTLIYFDFRLHKKNTDDEIEIDNRVSALERQMNVLRGTIDGTTTSFKQIQLHVRK